MSTRNNTPKIIKEQTIDIKNNYNRLYFLDVIKAIAIFFVCTYHFSIGGVSFDVDANSFSVKFFFDLFFFLVCSSCVPLFFMANGGGY